MNRSYFDFFATPKKKLRKKSENLRNKSSSLSHYMLSDACYVTHSTFSDALQLSKLK